jgi:hypothetical protein
MTLPELLDHLDRDGIHLEAIEGRLRVDAPIGALTAEIKSALAEHKPQLLRQAPATDQIRPLVPMHSSRNVNVQHRKRQRAVEAAALEVTETSTASTPTKPPRDYKAEAAHGDALRAAGLAVPLCWLPEPQERWQPPPLRGRREGDRLWFEGDTRKRKAQDTEEAERLGRRVALRLPPNPDAKFPRDVRRGDKCLPWHFEDSTDPAPAA